MKNRIAALIILSSMILCILPATALADLDTWDGVTVDTAWYDSNPDAALFTISTGAELAGLALLVNTGDDKTPGKIPFDFSGKTIMLGGDIYLGGHRWTPIGCYYNPGGGQPNEDASFNGVFDGGGNIISGLAIGSSGSPDTSQLAGLFGLVGMDSAGTPIPTSEVKNLGLQIAGIYSSSDFSIIGGIAARTGGKTENCSVVGSITAVEAEVGLIAGDSRGGDITYCHASGIVSDGPDWYAGGLVGYMDGGALTRCHADVTVTGGFTGGLVGKFTGSSIKDCYATGNVTCGRQFAGGFAGEIVGLSGSVSGCYATGNVTSSYGWGAYIGGFTGYTQLEIDNCFATGNVTSTGDVSGGGYAFLGGFVGQDETAKITNCYSSGNVEGGAYSYIGGLCGYNTASIENCYASGSVTSGSGNGSNIGGLLGICDFGTVNDCFARGTVSGSGTELNKGAVIGSMGSDATCTNCYYDTKESGVTAGIGNSPNSLVTTGLIPDKMTGAAVPSYMMGLVFPKIWTTKANDSKWYFPQLFVFSGSTDDAIKAASLNSVTLKPFKVTFDTGSGSAVASKYGYYTPVSEPKASTRDGYVFDKWYTDSGLTAKYDFSTEVTADITLYARWVIMITAESNNTEYGAVSGGGGYDKDASVTLTATPNAGYYFDGWYNGDTLVSSDAACSITAAKAATFTARFAPFINITAKSDNAAYGSVSGDGKFRSGESVALKATAKTGYYFTGWYDGNTLVSADAAFSFKAIQSVTLTARFGTFININVASNNAVYGSVSGGGSFTPGTPVTLTATPNTGYYFTGWYNGTTLVSASASYMFSATTDVTLIAQFDKIGVPGTITAAPSAYNKINISWSAVTGAKGYYIFRAASADGTYKKIGTSKKTAYVNSGVTTGTTYYYKVAAYTKAYTGKCYSAVASAASALGKVTGVTAKSSNPTKAVIKWKAVPGAKKYQVLRSDTKDGTYTAVKTTSSKTITDKGLIPGSMYYYKVVALRGTAYGPDSNIVSVTTKAAK